MSRLGFSTRVPEVEVTYHWHGTYQHLPPKDKKEWSSHLKNLMEKAKLRKSYGGSKKYPIELTSTWTVPSESRRRALQYIVRAMKEIMERHHRRMPKLDRNYGKSGGYRTRHAWWYPKIDVIKIKFA